MKASPSLSVSLAARPNDNFSLVLHTRDSVTFSTSRHKFDINRIAVLATQRNVFCVSKSGFTTANTRRSDLTALPRVMKLGLTSTDGLVCRN